MVSQTQSDTSPFCVYSNLLKVVVGILRGKVSCSVSLSLFSVFVCLSVCGCVCVYLWWPFRDGFIAQGLQGLHGSAVSGCLAGASLSNKLMTPHRQLHIEDLRDRIMVPGSNKTRGRNGVFIIKKTNIYEKQGTGEAQIL